MALDSALYVVSDGGNRRRAKKPHKALARRMRQAVYTRDDFTCQTCGYRPPSEDIRADWDWTYSPGQLSLDHVIPYRDGGLFIEDNLRTLCLSCNSRRGARP